MGLGQEMEAVKFVACGLAPVPPQPQLGSLGRAQEASKGSLKPQCDTQTPSLLGILSPSLHTSLTCKALFPVKEILAFTGWGTVLRDFFFFFPKDKNLLVQQAHLYRWSPLLSTRGLSGSERMGHMQRIQDLDSEDQGFQSSSDTQ